MLFGAETDAPQNIIPHHRIKDSPGNIARYYRKDHVWNYWLLRALNGAEWRVGTAATLCERHFSQFTNVCLVCRVMFERCIVKINRKTLGKALGLSSLISLGSMCSEWKDCVLSLSENLVEYSQLVIEATTLPSSCFPPSTATRRVSLLLPRQHNLNICRRDPLHRQHHSSPASIDFYFT